MTSLALGIATMLVVVGVMVAWAVREDRRLRRRAREYRELEFEGIEEMRRGDPYPEFGERDRSVIEPDGTRADRRAVQRDELRRLRDHMQRQKEEQHARHH